jgi:hypothetical protein
MSEEIVAQNAEAFPSRLDRVLIAAEALKSRGFGQGCSNEEVVTWSAYQSGTQEFSFFVSTVRRELAQYGMWLSGEGQEGKGFFIVRPSENAVVASRFQNKATRAIELMEQLLTNTPLEGMTDAEKRRHDKELRDLRFTNRIMRRKREVVEVIKKHKPGLLKDDVELE